MEELLASIRLIISDADRKSPMSRDAGQGRAAPAPAVHDSIAGDEVLDLTDELVFPEDNAAAASPAVKPAALPRASQALAPGGGGAAERQEPVSRDSTSPAAPRSGQTASQQRQEPKAPTVPSRPVWSRRELPFPNGQFDPPAPKPRKDAAQAKPSARNWAGDIQMAVPEQGPVSLVSPAEAEPAHGGFGAEQASGEDASAEAEKADTADEAAVAFLAQKLARSAVGSMEAVELETARQVDFGRIDEDSRSEVTEKFADAIERESASLSKPHALPSLLDEVFRQDFRRDPEPVDPGSQAPSPQAEMTDGGGHSPEEALGGEQEPEALPAAGPVRPAAPERSPEASNLRNQPAVSQPQPVPVQALVPSQAPVPAQPMRTLEDAVREMLRPLLVQWLNENMPRILESAIREEIAARGLLPGSDS